MNRDKLYGVIFSEITYKPQSICLEKRPSQLYNSQNVYYLVVIFPLPDWLQQYIHFIIPYLVIVPQIRM